MDEKNYDILDFCACRQERQDKKYSKKKSFDDCIENLNGWYFIETDDLPPF